MCGILGVRRGWRGADGFARALAALAWRGPDSMRSLDAGEWHLGVARLAITDRSADQPVVCPRTGRIVLFNGAVTSARAERARPGPPPASGNDAALVLRRLERDGAESLAGTCGPYALAVLDPHADTLWFARDPCGEKPLWIVIERGRVVAFASTPAALRELGVDPRLAPAEQARFLRFGFPLAAQAPELVLLSDLCGVAVSHRGGPLVPVVASGWRSSPPAPLRECVARAVARCLDTEVPAALSLSGGVDSACLAAAAAAQGLRPPAYQFLAAGEPPDERARAAEVAARTGLELRPVDAGPEILRLLPELSGHVGMPLGDPSVLAVHALARAAAQDGVRVLLSGEGADDLWLGYRRHRAAAWLPARGFRFVPAPQLATSNGARFLRALGAADPYAELLAVAPPEFLRAAVRLPPARLPPTARARSALARARVLDRACYLRHDLLPKLDVATMAAGVEGRCPFLDPEVLRAPASAADGPRQVLGKRPLRAAFAAELPASVSRAGKRGFAIPLDRWLREDSFLPDLLCDARTRQRPHLDADGLQRMLDLHRRGRARLGHALYLIAALELHLRALPCASSGS